MEIKTFRGKSLDQAGLAALARDPSLANTMALDLNENPLGDEGLRILGESRHTGALKALWLTRVGATDAGVEALAQSDMPVEQLYLGFNQVGPAGVKALLGLKNARLAILHLAYNPLTDAGARLLAESPRLAALERLEVGATHLTEAGVRALLSSTTLARLDTLDLGTTGPLPGLNVVGPTALEPLLDPAHLPALQSLYVRGSTPDSALLERLAKARPQLEITR